MDNLTALEWYTEQQAILNDKHQRENETLKKLYHAKQNMCAHTNESREEHLLYFCGETYPGVYCSDCGQRRHLTNEEKSNKKKRWYSFGGANGL